MITLVLKWVMSYAEEMFLNLPADTNIIQTYKNCRSLTFLVIMINNDKTKISLLFIMTISHISYPKYKCQTPVIKIVK